MVIGIYRIESDLPLQEAGRELAIEESIGTWTPLRTPQEWIRRDLAAKVFRWKGKHRGLVWVAFPLELFDIETGGIPNILSIVAGNLFGLGALKNVRLLDLEFPRELRKAFPGPRFGIEGIRSLLGTLQDRRPHLGTIIKPKVGLGPLETAKVAYEAALGGVDFIKDDETLVNQAFCRLEARVAKVMEALDKARSETGHRVLYALNVTSSPLRILELAERAKQNGANMLMVDVLTAGFSAIQALAEDASIRLPIHVHRTMHAAMTRNPRHGIAFLPIAKLVRLAGGDQLHSGTGAGKMERKMRETKEIVEFLRRPWLGFKPLFPVASGGIHPGIVPENLKALGTDIVINAGGGIHGHPLGTRAGAMAMRQAIDAFMASIALEDYARTNEELRIALETWGRRFGSGFGSGF
ncbi:ribulose 1,5-bisphosphate carboxylase [Candidatus Bathyarchaeota archaeon]|nr:ribulose 1,5-bisphosphate carboxylase [Candidatus Bathyarchaeota archaeon]